MNILFPVGGRGERFQGKFNLPKPLVKVRGKSLLQWSVETLKLEGRYIFVTLEYDDKSLNEELDQIIKNLHSDSIIIKLLEPTSGSAFTCLFAEQYIDNDEPLIITNCDQYLNWSSSDFISFLDREKPDGVVSIYDHDDVVLGEKSPYCFVKINDNGNIIEVREKFSISELSMNGIHYWRKGSDFIRSCKKMIDKNITVNGEYYLSGSLNFLIDEGKRFLPYKMEKDEFLSLGTPEDIDKNYHQIK